MLNIYDPTFYLEDSDLLSVEGPLSSDNISTTIGNMVKNIASSMGYNTCKSFDYNNFTNLDSIYDTTKSLVIPIFNEIINSDQTLGNTLTNANVSFLVLTPRCGEIEPSDNDHYNCTGSTGQILNDGLSAVPNVMCKRLTNIRLYRYLNDNGKYDCSPICLDIISPIYYGYNSTSKEVKLCIEGISNFYIKQQIMTILPKFLPLYPSNFILPFVSDIKPISDDSDSIFISNDIQINDIETNANACHIYSNFYLLENNN